MEEDIINVLRECNSEVDTDALYSLLDSFTTKDITAALIELQASGLIEYSNNKKTIKLIGG